MLRKIINTTLFLPLSFLVTFQQSLLSENKYSIDEIIRINENKTFIDNQEIKNIILNNNELKSLKELKKSGYKDSSDYDLFATKWHNDSNKVGLIYH